MTDSELHGARNSQDRSDSSEVMSSFGHMVLLHRVHH
jgi:hypothetical protein